MNILTVISFSGYNKFHFKLKNQQLDAIHFVHRFNPETTVNRHFPIRLAIDI